MNDTHAADERVARFAATMGELETELDWRKLGAGYCDEGGEHFFEGDQRSGVIDAGLRFAADVTASLSGLPDRDERGSLYVGVGVAELAPLLAEHLLLGRRVRAHTLPGSEPVELNRALDAVGRRLDCELVRIETDPFEVAAVAPIDHLWLVSVLTDPEHFPALHDLLYERAGTSLATGRGNADEESARAAELVARAVACLRPPALVTTSDEELEWLRRACSQASLRLFVPDQARLSGIVGDRVRSCRVSAADGR